MSLEIQRQVAEYIGEQMPPGIGAADECWDATAPAHDAFVEACKAFSTHDTAKTREAVVKTANDWVRAWVKTARDWELQQNTP